MKASENIPVHVGIIMDGNGRWAQARGLNRSAGHREGLEAAKRIVGAASRAGIKWLSLYTFSTENWKRTTEEVGCLMDLLVRNLRGQMDFYVKNQIRIVHSGDAEGLPEGVRREIQEVVRLTREFSGLTVNLAINYGGRDEILRSVRQKLLQLMDSNPDPVRLRTALSSLGEESLSDCLDVPEMPDVDLLIRTGGECRLSNFMLWKSAYAELWFSRRYWPDWDALDLETALSEYSRRNRRFGGTPLQGESRPSSTGLDSQEADTATWQINQVLAAARG